MTTTPATPSLNALLTEHMRRHGIETLREFANQSGISATSLYDLVRNDHDSRRAAAHSTRQAPRPNYPSIATLINLARALGRPTHELLYLLCPDAPGADTLPPNAAAQSALSRLQTLGQQLPQASTDDFLHRRRQDGADQA